MTNELMNYKSLSEVINEVYRENKKAFDTNFALYTKAEWKIVSYYLDKGIALDGLREKIIPTKAHELYKRFKNIYC